LTAPRLRRERLATQFPARLAVDARSLDGEPGDIYGLIDPDGSGGSRAHRRLKTFETA
jgi:ABC-type branched-subunit amino acid transport system ATPase component